MTAVVAELPEPPELSPQGVEALASFDAEADAAWWAEILATEPTGPATNGHKPAADNAAITSLADLYAPIDWHDLWEATAAEPDWLIPDVIERGRLHAIYAPRKHKKSLLALLMIGELITCRPLLLGHPNPHETALRVLYIDIENAKDDIRQRLQAAGYGPDDLANLTYFSFPSLPGLDSADGGLHLLALIERHKPDLMVLDTTSRVVTGKENDADTFRALYRHTLAPIKATGTAILRLDHAGKNLEMGQRGSSAKGDDLDTAWVISMPSPERLTMRLDFQRTNHHPQEIELAQLRGPLRFVRLDEASIRPEIAAVIAELERLGVPSDAGRPTAASALRKIGKKVRNADLSAALKIRKSCPQDHGTVSVANDPMEIDKAVPDLDTWPTIPPAQSCPGQVGDSGDSSVVPTRSTTVPDLGVPGRGHPKEGSGAVGRSGQPEDQPKCRRCGSSDDRIIHGLALCARCAYPTSTKDQEEES